MHTLYRRGLMKACLIMAALLLSQAARADAENCKDHPLFNRLAGYEIESCTVAEFDEVEFPVGEPVDCRPASLEKVEGKRTDILYVKQENAAVKSPLQIVRNYQNAVKQAGGRTVIEYGANATPRVLCDPAGIYYYGDRVSTLNLNKDGHDIWVMVFPFVAGDNHYGLRIIEREAMQQEINVSDWLKQLNDKGLLTLYINFDSGKATVKADSQATVDKMLVLLQQAPQLKLEIAGHTDNVGNAAANQKLSEQRAQALMQALTSKGINNTRLIAKGYGATRPIADNSSEDGRSKNRRVELIKR